MITVAVIVIYALIGTFVGSYIYHCDNIYLHKDRDGAVLFAISWPIAVSVFALYLLYKLALKSVLIPPIMLGKFVASFGKKLAEAQERKRKEEENKPGPPKEYEEWHRKRIQKDDIQIEAEEEVERVLRDRA